MKQDNRSKVYKGMTSQTLVTFTLGILGILYFAVMSRLLSKEDFGYFAIITAVTSILASLSEAGLGAAVIQNRNANKSYIQTAWTLSLIIGSVFCILLVGSAGLLSRVMVKSNILERGYQIISLTLIFFSINGVGRATIIKNLQLLKYGIFDIIAYSLSSLIGVFMAYKGYGFYSVVIAMLLHQSFIGIQILISNRKIIAIRIKKEYVKQIVSFGGWLTGSVIIRNINDQLDKLITRHWIPVAELGAYNRPAGFISQITGNINGIFDTILFPILSGINDSTKKVDAAYQKAVSLIILFSIVLSAIFVLGAEIIISIFLGSKWLYLSNIFQIVSISIVFLSYNRIADCFFRSIGIVKQYFYVRCCIMLCTCFCMIVGCQFGITGLALGLVSSRLIDIILKRHFLKPFISFSRKDFYKNAFKSWIIPILLFVTCYVIKLIVPYGSIVSLTTFIIIMLLLCIIKPQLLGSVFYENVYEVVWKKYERCLH